MSINCGETLRLDAQVGPWWLDKTDCLPER